MEEEHFDYENGKQTSRKLYPSLSKENLDSSQRSGSSEINNDIGRMRLSSNAFLEKADQTSDESLSPKSLDVTDTGMSFEIIPDDMSQEYNERREESPAMASESLTGSAASQRSAKTEETDVSTDEEFSDCNNRSTAPSMRLISPRSTSLDDSQRSQSVRSIRGRGRGRLVKDKNIPLEIPKLTKKTNLGDTKKCPTLVLRPGQCKAEPSKALDPEQFSDADEDTFHEKSQPASLPVPAKRAFNEHSRENELCEDQNSKNELSEDESTKIEISEDEKSCDARVTQNMQDDHHVERSREMEETIKTLRDELQSLTIQHTVKEDKLKDTIESLRKELEQTQTKNVALENRNKQFQQHLKQAKEEYSDLDAAYDKMDEDFKKYEGDMEEKVKSLKQQILKKDEDVTKYETEMKEYVGSLQDDIESMSKKFQCRIEELESEVGQWKKARENSNQQALYFLRSAAESQSKLEEERNKMKNDLEWKQSECDAMQFQLQQMKTKLDDQETEIRRLYQAEQDLQTNIRTEMEEKERLLMEKYQVESNVSEYKDLAENQKQQLLMQSVRRKDIEKILNDEKVKAQKQKEEYEKSQSRLDELEEDNNCKICFDPFNDTDHYQIALKCGHKFGNTCIKSSFARRKNCPTCNQQASEDDFRRLYNN